MGWNFSYTCVLGFLIISCCIAATPDSFLLSGRGKCETGQFECDDGNCIENKQVCDSRKDCHDDSDENKCHCLSLDGMIPCTNAGKIECFTEEAVCKEDKLDCGSFNKSIDCSQLSTTLETISTTLVTNTPPRIPPTAIDEKDVSKQFTATILSTILATSSNDSESSTTSAPHSTDDNPSESINTTEVSAESTPITEENSLEEGQPESTTEFSNATGDIFVNDNSTFSTITESTDAGSSTIDEETPPNEYTSTATDPIFTTEFPENETEAFVNESDLLDITAAYNSAVPAADELKLNLIIPLVVIGGLMAICFVVLFIFRRRRKSAVYKCKA